MERPQTMLNLDGDILMEPLREIHEHFHNRKAAYLGVMDRIKRDCLDKPDIIWKGKSQISLKKAVSQTPLLVKGYTWPLSGV